MVDSDMYMLPPMKLCLLTVIRKLAVAVYMCIAVMWFENETITFVQK